MGSQPPYGSYPPPNQPWPEQPSEPAAPSYEQPGAYPPPPSYGAPSYPYPSQPGSAPIPPSQPPYGYAAPNIYVQPAAPYPYVVAPPDPGSGQAVTSLVLGIISIVFTFIPCFGFVAIVTGIIGLIMGIIGRKSMTRHGMAVTGMVLSIISLGLAVLFIVLYIGLNVISLSTAPQY